MRNIDNIVFKDTDKYSADKSIIENFLEAVPKLGKSDMGRTVEFTCPRCGGIALACRTKEKGLLRAECTNCKTFLQE